MKPNIEGDYRSGEHTIRIQRARQTHWQTAYSVSGDPAYRRLPVFTQEYYVDMPHDCVGTSRFNGKQLVGFFQPRIVAQGRWENGVLVALPYTGGPMLTGTFTATLREDGNFDVVIEQSDDRPSSGKHKPGSIHFSVFGSISEPEMEHIETVWIKV